MDLLTVCALLVLAVAFAYLYGVLKAAENDADG